MIDYEPDGATKIRVYLDGRRAGTIKKSVAGWQYFSMGKKFGGSCYKKLDDCKKSIEAP
jgi:hypothetical protein